jgi:hypothetical protein
MSQPINLSDPFPSSFSLSIAGITVSVMCNDATLVAALRRRYHAFSAHNVAQLIARVYVSGRLRASALLAPDIVFRGGVLYFTASGYEGFIHEEAQEAELRLSSTQPVEDVDYFLRVIYALLAFRDGGLLFHAAGIVRQGRAYLFFGPSGCGKTTVARLSRDDQVLNDDLVLLLPAEEGWLAYATPFWNPSQVRPAGPTAAPVAGMFRLVQDVQVYLEEMGQAQALAELMASVPVVTCDPQRARQLLEVCQNLLDAVPVAALHFLPDASFWRLVVKEREGVRK